MASTGRDAPASIGLDVAAQRLPERVELVDRGGIGAGQRRQDAPAAVEQVGEAGLGAGMLGAGDRMAGDEMHAVGQCGAIVATTACLTEPTSVTMAPGLSAGAIACGDLAAGADRRRRRHQVGVRARGREVGAA